MKQLFFIMHKSMLLQIVGIMGKLLTKHTRFTVSLCGIHVGGKMPRQMFCLLKHSFTSPTLLNVS